MHSSAPTHSGGVRAIMKRQNIWPNPPQVGTLQTQLKLTHPAERHAGDVEQHRQYAHEAAEGDHRDARHQDRLLGAAVWLDVCPASVYSADVKLLCAQCRSGWTLCTECAVQ